MELISVIVPVYKVEKYLDRCVKSIIEQTYPDLEIILVDDGSPDKCPDLCDDWAKKDARIKVIHKSNGGLSSARNAGLDFATGSYYVLVDSDDYIAVNMIETLYSGLKDNNADMAICGYAKGSEEAFEFGKINKQSWYVEDSVNALKRIYESADLAQMYASAWGKLYKKELFDGIRYPDGKIFEDIYTTHQILYRCNKIAIIPDKLVYYYQHPESIMNAAFNIKKLDYLQALKERIIFFREKKLGELEEIAYDEYLHALIWEYSRARDLLNSKSAMKDIKARFREIYKSGYASKRYPKETSSFLSAFSLSPELIIFYWKVSGRINRLFKR